MFGTCREAFESITSADVKLDDDAGIGDRVGQRVQGAAFLRDLTARGLTGVRLVTPRLAAWSTQTVRPCPPRAGNAAAPSGVQVLSHGRGLGIVRHVRDGRDRRMNAFR